MYSLYAKKEPAHQDSIWTCAWGRLPERTVEIAKSPKEDSAEGEEAEKNVETKTLEAEDIIVTGGVDDIVKIWGYDDGELKLRHKLSDHSLGVVSVTLSQDGKRELTA